MQQHVDNLLSAYLDQEATGEERLLVENHLAVCETCKHLADELMELKSTVKFTYHGLEEPDTIEQNVLARIGKETPSLVWMVWMALSTVLLPFALIWLGMSRLGAFSMGLIASGVRVMYRVFHLVTVLLSAIPYAVVSVSVISLVLLLISVWLLRRLMIVKESL